MNRPVPQPAGAKVGAPPAAPDASHGPAPEPAVAESLGSHERLLLRHGLITHLATLPDGAEAQQVGQFQREASRVARNVLPLSRTRFGVLLAPGTDGPLSRVAHELIPLAPPTPTPPDLAGPVPPLAADADAPTPPPPAGGDGAPGERAPDPAEAARPLFGPVDGTAQTAAAPDGRGTSLDAGRDGAMAGWAEAEVAPPAQPGPARAAEGAPAPAEAAGREPAPAPERGAPDEPADLPQSLGAPDAAAPIAPDAPPAPPGIGTDPPSDTPGVAAADTAPAPPPERAGAPAAAMHADGLDAIPRPDGPAPQERAAAPSPRPAPHTAHGAEANPLADPVAPAEARARATAPSPPGAGTGETGRPEAGVAASVAEPGDAAPDGAPQPPAPPASPQGPSASTDTAPPRPAEATGQPAAPGAPQAPQATQAQMAPEDSSTRPSTGAAARSSPPPGADADDIAERLAERLGPLLDARIAARLDGEAGADLRRSIVEDVRRVAAEDRQAPPGTLTSEDVGRFWAGMEATLRLLNAFIARMEAAASRPPSGLDEVEAAVALGFEAAGEAREAHHAALEARLARLEDRPAAPTPDPDTVMQPVLAEIARLREEHTAAEAARHDEAARLRTALDALREDLDATTRRERSDGAALAQAISALRDEASGIGDAVGAMRDEGARIDGLAEAVRQTTTLAERIDGLAEAVREVPALAQRIDALAEMARTGADLAERIDHLSETASASADLPQRIDALAETVGDTAGLEERIGALAERMTGTAALEQRIDDLAEAVGSTAALAERIDGLAEAARESAALAPRIDGLADRLAERGGLFSEALDTAHRSMKNFWLASEDALGRLDGGLSRLEDAAPSERLPEIDRRLTALQDQLDRVEAQQADAARTQTELRHTLAEAIALQTRAEIRRAASGHDSDGADGS